MDSNRTLPPLPDTRMSEDVVGSVGSMYRKTDRIVVRRAAYREFAIHQEGDGRSVYLTRKATVRFALRLLRSALAR